MAMVKGRHSAPELQQWSRFKIANHDSSFALNVLRVLVKRPGQALACRGHQSLGVNQGFNASQAGRW
jgi:hypothetical protein